LRLAPHTICKSRYTKYELLLSEAESETPIGFTMASAFARSVTRKRVQSETDSKSHIAARSGYAARQKVKIKSLGKTYRPPSGGDYLMGEVQLPPKAHPDVADRSRLWNAANDQISENEKVTGIELLLALPSPEELSTLEMADLVRAFTQPFIDFGLAVQWDLHRGKQLPRRGYAHHAHLILSARRLVGGEFKRGASDNPWLPDIRGGRGGQRRRSISAPNWSALWRDCQERFFLEHGIDVRVPAFSGVAEFNLGRARTLPKGSAAHRELMDIRRERIESMRQPAKVFEALLADRSTFDERDLEDYLAANLHSPYLRKRLKAKVLADVECVPLDEAQVSRRYTTPQALKRAMTCRALAASLRAADKHPVLWGEPDNDSHAVPFEPQHHPVRHALGPEGLAVLEGADRQSLIEAVIEVGSDYEEEGYQIVIVTPSPVSRKLLGNLRAAQGVTYLDLRAWKSRPELDAIGGNRAVIVVIDAHCLNDADAHFVLAKSNDSGAKLVLMVDQSVPSSQRSGLLIKSIITAYGIADILPNRPVIPGYRSSVQSRSGGNPRHADLLINQTQGQDRLHWSGLGSLDQELEAMVRELGSNLKIGEIGAIVTGDQQEADQINALLREHLNGPGNSTSVIEIKTADGPIRFIPGEWVQIIDDVRLRAVGTRTPRLIPGGTVAQVTGKIKKDGPVLDLGRKRLVVVPREEPPEDEEGHGGNRSSDTAGAGASRTAAKSPLRIRSTFAVPLRYAHQVTATNPRVWISRINTAWKLVAWSAARQPASVLVWSKLAESREALADRIRQAHSFSTDPLVRAAEALGIRGDMSDSTVEDYVLPDSAPRSEDLEMLDDFEPADDPEFMWDDTADFEDDPDFDSLIRSEDHDPDLAWDDGTDQESDNDIDPPDDEI
jgi:hypothetical protein